MIDSDRTTAPASQAAARMAHGPRIPPSDDVALSEARHLRHAWYRAHSRTLLTVAAIAVALLTSWQTYRITERSALDAARAISEERLALYTSTLQGVIEKYRYLSFVLALNKDIIGLLDGRQHADTVNPHLETVNREAGAAALFIMDTRGDTIASSNWREALSFVGNNYAFRPYFQRAASGETGEFFAIGVTTGLPGYFMSAPIRSGERITGVAVVKVDLGRLEKEWANGGETVLVSDGNDVVFLSSRADWKYQSLRPLAPEAMARIRARKQYYGVGLKALGIGPAREGVDDALTIDGEAFLTRSRSLTQPGWRIHFLSPLEPIRRHLLGVLLITVVSAVLLLTLALYLRERRARQQARAHAREAQALRRFSAQLQTEIEERRRTETELRTTQAELIQAGKLAALGQMSAAIAHELNQPIGAIRTFTASAQRFLELGRHDDLRKNLGAVSELTARMAAITRGLKTFARKSEGHNQAVSLNEPIAAALALLEGQIRIAATEVHLELATPAPQISGDPVRIEQVLINLINNALDAMRDSPVRHLTISLTQDAEAAQISIRDTGHGISSAHLALLFDPFFTTKEVGEGVGLGLSISYGIVADMGGTVRAGNNADGNGATFTIRLPLLANTNPGEAP